MRYAIGGVLLLCLTGLSGVAAQAAPAAIYLIRHAEKPADDADPHLSPRGRARAAALVRLFDGERDKRFWRATHIFAAKPSREGGSRRSIETVTPLSDALGVAINRYYSKDTTDNLAARLLEDSSLDGAIVVIAWPRDEIPELAYNLGVDSPPEWEKEKFDRVWKITFPHQDPEESPGFRDLPMRLLPGDSV